LMMPARRGWGTRIDELPKAEGVRNGEK